MGRPEVRPTTKVGQTTPDTALIIPLLNRPAALFWLETPHRTLDCRHREAEPRLQRS